MDRYVRTNTERTRRFIRLPLSDRYMLDLFFSIGSLLTVWPVSAGGESDERRE